MARHGGGINGAILQLLIAKAKKNNKIFMNPVTPGTILTRMTFKI
jgi:hypothetical protein